MKDYEELSVAEGIELGLRQAIEIQQGKLQAGYITTLKLEPHTKEPEKTQD